MTSVRAVADHPDDVYAYTDAEEATILSLTERAYEAGYDEQLQSFDESGQRLSFTRSREAR